MRKIFFCLLFAGVAFMAFPMKSWAPIPPLPCIDIEKLVSVDDGQSFYDADSCMGAPVTDQSAEYRLEVENCGIIDLSNVVVTDAELGISHVIGDLAAGQTVILGIGEIPELFIEDVCALGFQFENTATATGEDLYGRTVTDTDPACVKCYEEAPGTGTPGYWMNHPEAWPVEEIMIGGVTYTKDEAIDYMMAPVRGDKTLTMFPALVAAKLNVLIGNDDSCIVDTIAEADAWMAQNPVGSGIRGSSGAWKIGEPLYLILDNYNNGLLCAPSRDSFELGSTTDS